jgi:hypothetical protein
MKKLALPIVLLFVAPAAHAAKLHDETLQAWETYRKLTETRIEKELSSTSGFLVREFLEARRAQKVRSEYRSGISVQKMETRSEEGGKIEIPKGLVHHWYGTTFVPGATVQEVVAWVQDYDRHQDYFKEVEDSRLISHGEQLFEIFLRLRREKILTVHYNTEHEVTYRDLGPGRAASRSVATRIAEIDNAGSAREKEKPIGDDRGYLWRLNSYWRFFQEEGGVAVECESISLSRDIPLGFKLIVQPFINDVPRESLEAALLPLREALSSKAPSARPVALTKR